MGGGITPIKLLIWFDVSKQKLNCPVFHLNNYFLHLLKKFKSHAGYVETFTEFVEYMEANPNIDVLDAFTIFGKNGKKKIMEMQDWIENEGVANFDRVSVNTKLLDDEDICTIWHHFLEDAKQSKKEDLMTSVLTKPNLLFKVSRACVYFVQLLHLYTCVRLMVKYLGVMKLFSFSAWS